MGQPAPRAIPLRPHDLLRAAIIEALGHYQSDRAALPIYFASVATALSIAPQEWASLALALTGRRIIERSLSPWIDDIRHELLVKQSINRGRR